jgi:hypothetical protein
MKIACALFLMTVLATAAPVAASEVETESAPVAPSAVPVPPTDRSPLGEPAPMPEPVAAQTGTVARSTLTTDVLDHEPQDSITTLTSDNVRVLYFTELRGFEGQTVVHRWTFEGRTMAEVDIAVGGPRWRVYSSKNLEPSWTGEWTVSVVDAAGRTLTTDTFTLTPTTAEDGTTAASAPAATPSETAPPAAMPR